MAVSMPSVRDTRAEALALCLSVFCGRPPRCPHLTRRACSTSSHSWIALPSIVLAAADIAISLGRYSVLMIVCLRLITLCYRVSHCCARVNNFMLRFWAAAVSLGRRPKGSTVDDKGRSKVRAIKIEQRPKA